MCQLRLHRELTVVEEEEDGDPWPWPGWPRSPGMQKLEKTDKYVPTWWSLGDVVLNTKRQKMRKRRAQSCVVRAVLGVLRDA